MGANKSKAIIIIGIILAALLLFGCTQPKPLTQEQINYSGSWATKTNPNDANSIYYSFLIKNDGTADFEGKDAAFAQFGGSSTLTIKGAPLVITDTNISVSMFGISKTFTIDQKPTTQNGETTMVLNGMTFYRK